MLVALDVYRAERLLDEYKSGAASRETSIAKLMAVFGLEQRDAEVVMDEIDADTN